MSSGSGLDLSADFADFADEERIWRFLVNRFEKAAAQLAMNLHGRADDGVRPRVALPICFHLVYPQICVICVICGSTRAYGVPAAQRNPMVVTRLDGGLLSRSAERQCDG